MEAKDLKSGDLIWAFQIKGEMYENESPILNCYSINSIREDEIVTTQFEMYDYKSIFDEDDWGSVYLPKNYDLDNPIIEVYNIDRTIWCYGTNDKKVAELYSLFLRGELNLRNMVLYTVENGAFVSGKKLIKHK